MNEELGCIKQKLEEIKKALKDIEKSYFVLVYEVNRKAIQEFSTIDDVIDNFVTEKLIVVEHVPLELSEYRLLKLWRRYLEDLKLENMPISSKVLFKKVGKLKGVKRCGQLHKFYGIDER